VRAHDLAHLVLESAAACWVETTTEVAPHRLAVDVAQRDLALGVGPEPGSAPEWRASASERRIAWA
jgi:hypothetical protein